MSIPEDQNPNSKCQFGATPEEHAEYVVKRLEQFIRNGRTVSEGMSFKKWQNMAKIEITQSIIEATNQQNNNAVSQFIIFVSAAAMITIGFWGAAVSLNKTDLLTAALICFFAGFSILLVAAWIRYRKYIQQKTDLKRLVSLRRIDDLNKRIKRLERELEAEEKDRQEQIDQIRKPHGKSLFEVLTQ